MLVVLDRGHGDKGGKFDPGVVSGTLREVDLAWGYMAEAAVALRSAGHDVLLLNAGSYDHRHRQAIEEAKRHEEALYIQCHVNAGGGKYGLVEHDARSSWGKRAAAAIADALDELPETPKVLIWDLDSTERGWSCIDGIYESPTMTAVLFEPGFIDGPQHAELWKPAGLARVGKALAEGVKRYAAGIAARKAA